jgi:hypothetical protein
LEETEDVLQTWNKEVEGRGEPDGREVGWVAVEAITRWSGQGKECYEEIKVQQVRALKHGGRFDFLQEKDVSRLQIPWAVNVNIFIVAQTKPVCQAKQRDYQAKGIGHCYRSWILLVKQHSANDQQEVHWIKVQFQYGGGASILR